MEAETLISSPKISRDHQVVYTGYLGHKQMPRERLISSISNPHPVRKKSHPVRQKSIMWRHMKGDRHAGIPPITLYRRKRPYGFIHEKGKATIKNVHFSWGRVHVTEWLLAESAYWPRVNHFRIIFLFDHDHVIIRITKVVVRCLLFKILLCNDKELFARLLK